MVWRHQIVTLIALISSFGIGCETTNKGEPAGEPDIAGKADFMDQLDIRGEIELAEVDGALIGEASSSFTEDFEYHGYTLMTSGDTELRVEVTQLGTSRDLDTAL